MRYWEQHKGEVDHPVIFDALAGLPDKEMSSEAMNIIIAGGETTSATLTYAVTAVTGDPQIHQRLISELETALTARGRKKGERLPLNELEEIPYLMAVVRESLRCAVAQAARLPRVVPADGEPLIVDGKVVPPGVSLLPSHQTRCESDAHIPFHLQTVVGMSTYTMNMSEEIFGPDARVFNPERWMQPNSKQLGDNLYTFSKGARMCLGLK